MKTQKTRPPRYALKKETHTFIKGEWSEIKTSDGLLVLGRSSTPNLQSVYTEHKRWEYRPTPGYTVSPSVVPLTHSYHCVSPESNELRKLLALEGTVVVDNPTQSNTEGYIWLKVIDPFEVHSVSDLYDWTRLKKCQDVRTYDRSEVPKYGLHLYDFAAEFKKYQEQDYIARILADLGVSEIKMDEIDLSWYRFTNNGSIAIDEACNEYVFNSIMRKDISIADAPLMWIAPCKSE